VTMVHLISAKHRGVRGSCDYGEGKGHPITGHPGPRGGVEV
jgi:hypothetical protein